MICGPSCRNDSSCAPHPTPLKCRTLIRARSARHCYREALDVQGRTTIRPSSRFSPGPSVWGTRLILAYPVATIAVAIGCVWWPLALTGTRLGYRTSRLDLINPKSDYNRLWMEYIQEFGEEDDAVIVVEGAGREQVVPVLEELSKELARENRLFHAVLHEVDLGRIRCKGLHYLSPAS